MSDNRVSVLDESLTSLVDQGLNSSDSASIRSWVVDNLESDSSAGNGMLMILNELSRRSVPNASTILSGFAGLLNQRPETPEDMGRAALDAQTVVNQLHEGVRRPQKKITAEPPKHGDQRSRIQAVMRDSKLSPAERSKAIQEIVSPRSSELLQKKVVESEDTVERTTNVVVRVVCLHEGSEVVENRQIVSIIGAKKRIPSKYMESAGSFTLPRSFYEALVNTTRDQTVADSAMVQRRVSPSVRLADAAGALSMAGGEPEAAVPGGSRLRTSSTEATDAHVEITDELLTASVRAVLRGLVNVLRGSAAEPESESGEEEQMAAVFESETEDEVPEVEDTRLLFNHVPPNAEWLGIEYDFGRHEGDEPVRVDISYIVEQQQGCRHYLRGCALICPVCEIEGQDAAFTCRVCHNNTRDHELPRHEVTELQCLSCNARVPKGASCPECGASFGTYTCLKCSFFDSFPNKEMYHCDACGLCRMGSRENFVHCDRCGGCWAKDSNHNCVGDGMRQPCPVCLEQLHESRLPIVAMPCGHLVHLHCHSQLFRNAVPTCPICRKLVLTGKDREHWEKMVHEWVVSQPTPEEYADKDVSALCNECGSHFRDKLSFTAYKCPECGSYNTTAT